MEMLMEYANIVQYDQVVGILHILYLFTILDLYEESRDSKLK